MAAAVSTVSQNACTDTRGAGAMRSSRPAMSAGALSCQAAWLAGFVMLVRHHWPMEVLILAESADGYCVAVGTPCRYFSTTVVRRIVYGGVSPRGCTRSAGSSTIAARLRCVAHPKFQGGWFSK